MSNLNLNVNPYFDDYDESRNYYKILFKPGVALQARELTQVQTILQNQISKIGSYLFKDGTSTTGTDTSTISVNYEVRSIKLNPSYNNNAINVNNYLGKWVIGATTGILGEVKFVYQEDFPDIGDPPTITITITRLASNTFFADGETLNFYDSMVDALNSGTPKYSALVSSSNKTYLISTVTPYSDEIQINGSTAGIKVGDYVVFTNIPEDVVVTQIKNATTLLLNKPISFSIFNERVEFNRRSSTHSLIVNVDSGTYFKNGTFVTNKQQSIVPAKYTAHPTVAIGFRFEETIVNSDSDGSLLDPSLGSSNYFAQGADRLKYELVLEKIDLINDNTSVTQKPNISDTFIELLRFNQGKKDILVNTSVKSPLRQELAKRTYDESGNYIVSPFGLSLFPTSNTSNQFRFDITPGTAYIGGYEVTTVAPTPMYLNRALDTGSEISYNVSTSYGNYILVDKITSGLITETIPGSNAIIEAHSVTNPTSTSTRVGYLAFKNLSYESGTEANSVYRLHSYFFYPDKTNNLSINDAKSFILVNNSLNNITAAYNNPVFKANVASAGLLDSNIIIFESKIDRMVFPIPRNNIQSVDRISTQYNKLFKDVQFTSGVATITVNAPESFVGADGTLTASEKRENFIAVVKTQSGSTSAGFYPVDKSNVAIALSNQGKFATFTLTDTAFNGTMDIDATIDNDDTAIRTKALSNIIGTKVNITLSDTDYQLGYSDIKKFFRISKIGSNVFTGTYSTATSYVTNNIVLDSTNGIFYRALQNSSNQPLYDLTYWQSLPAESTLDYYLFNGQKDNMYDHGTIRWLPETTAPGNVVVSFNYYSHSGQGPVVADSYPSYDDIEKFVSPLDFTEIELRDAIDFRPRRVDSISNYMVFQEAVKPNPTFLTELDITYYKPRYDRLYITNQETDLNSRGQRFFIEYGIPSLNPSLPPDKTSKDVQLLYNIYVQPYTSNVYLNKFEKISIDRYTMKSIGDIDKRLIDVERKVRRQGLEIQALNARITDPSGVELFKTGVFIDDFKDYTKADITNSNFKATIDVTKEEARPPSTSRIVPLGFRSLSNMQQADRILQMQKDSDEVMLSLLNPTNTINANPGKISPGPVTIIKSGDVPGYIGNGVEPSVNVKNALTLLNAAWNNRSGLIRHSAFGSASYPGDLAGANTPFVRKYPFADYTSTHSNASLTGLSNYTTVIMAMGGSVGGLQAAYINGESASAIYTIWFGSDKPYIAVFHFEGQVSTITSVRSYWATNQGYHVNNGAWPMHYIVPGRWGVSKVYYANNNYGQGPFVNFLPKDRFRFTVQNSGANNGNNIYILSDSELSTKVITAAHWYNAHQAMIGYNLRGLDTGSVITSALGPGISPPITIMDFYKLPEYATGEQPAMPAPSIISIEGDPPPPDNSGGSSF